MIIIIVVVVIIIISMIVVLIATTMIVMIVVFIFPEKRIGASNRSFQTWLRINFFSPFFVSVWFWCLFPLRPCRLSCRCCLVGGFNPFEKY